MSLKILHQYDCAGSGCTGVKESDLAFCVVHYMVFVGSLHSRRLFMCILRVVDSSASNQEAL